MVKFSHDWTHPQIHWNTLIPLIFIFNWIASFSLSRLSLCVVFVSLLLWSLLHPFVIFSIRPYLLVHCIWWIPKMCVLFTMWWICGCLFATFIIAIQWVCLCLFMIKFIWALVNMAEINRRSCLLNQINSPKKIIYSPFLSVYSKKRKSFE